MLIRDQEYALFEMEKLTNSHQTGSIWESKETFRDAGEEGRREQAPPCLLVGEQGEQGYPR